MVIAEFAVGGGVLAIGPMPGRGGFYAADLAEVLAWGPALALTMTTAEELAAKGAEGLSRDLSEAGTEWLHLPIADYGAPSGGTLAAWPAASTRAREVLAGEAGSGCIAWAVAGGQGRLRCG